VRRRKLTAEGKIILLIAAFILFLILYPAVFASRNETKPPSGGITLEIEKGEQYVNVYNGDSVESMELEDYLVGVVAAEMPASFELEALKAQAVAARTYTSYIKSHGGCSSNAEADICTNSRCCQAYLSREDMEKRWESNLDAYVSKIEEAVFSTRGEKIFYNGDEIQAFYHACSGGWTEDCANVYVEDLPYLKSVKSQGEEGYSHFSDRVALSPQEFVSAMKKYSPSINIDAGSLSSGISEIKRFDSGRVQSIKIGNEYFTGREVRTIFSLNSAAFTVSVTDKVIFDTTGFGHGVGMSQDGADAMAKRGSDYIDILTHYYTGVTVK
jgi:stage II sporulation protein D